MYETIYCIILLILCIYILITTIKRKRKEKLNFNDEKKSIIVPPNSDKIFPHKLSRRNFINKRLDNKSEQFQTLLTSIKLNNKIPKIIHHTWKNENIHDLHKNSYNSWRKHFPEGEYIYMFWIDDELEPFMKRYYPEYLKMFKDYPMKINRIDAIRYFILNLYGGIYGDMDYKVHKNFYENLDHDKFNAVESPYKFNEDVQNSLMASKPNHVFLTKLLPELHNTKNNSNILMNAGPHFLTKIKNMYPYTVHELPCNKYQRIGDKEKVYYLNKQKLLKTSCGFMSDTNKDIYGEHILTSVWTTYNE